MTGAATCVSVTGAATGVALSHLVVRGCATAGIKVAAGGSAAIANATVTGDGAGVEAAGGATTTIKNSLLFGDDVALESETPNALVSSYDDLFGNTTSYQGLVAGPGDLASAVTFVDAAGHNYRLPGPQATTDQGDPTDDVGAEPTPNGARINLGAFGGTAEAELSVPAAVTGDPGSATGTPATPTPTGPTGPTGETTGGSEAGGCALGGGRPGGSILSSVAIALASFLTRARRRRRRPTSVEPRRS